MVLSLITQSCVGAAHMAVAMVWCCKGTDYSSARLYKYYGFAYTNCGFRLRFTLFPSGCRSEVRKIRYLCRAKTLKT